jgi:hypothetical protein
VEIDFLNIDVELMEFDILSDWDFTRWNPKVIAVEIHGPSDIVKLAQSSPIFMLLKKHGYTFASRLWHTVIFAKMPASALP